MKRIARWLPKLYPPAWRRRYAREFEALLEDTNLHTSDYLDVLKGALSMRLMQANAWKPTAVLVLIGLAVSAVVAVTWKDTYASAARFRVVVPNSSSRDVAAFLHDEAEALSSRGNLVTLINSHNLYPRERKVHTLEDVVMRMQNDVSIHSIQRLQASNGAMDVELGFRYEDPAIAQAVTNDLMSRLIDNNVRARRDGDRPGTIEVLSNPILPKDPIYPNRPVLLFTGALAGLLLGGAFVLTRSIVRRIAARRT